MNEKVDTNLKGAQSKRSRMSSIGGFAKTTRDLADLTAAAMSEKVLGKVSASPILIDTWNFPDGLSESEEIAQALAKVESLGATVTHDAPLTTLGDLVEKHGAPELGPVGGTRPSTQGVGARVSNLK
ncbi:hypothetical protein N7493_010773 [Penicillium malachiteum]|uniref:Uncharacterized protein n=1 Tax=Penicillium malachiteum TaxID=1324776 RepID=A0AAD6HDT3_9EURO|nr:hypothetical protein N7493_010773 [Penicillium malachiteum]